MKISLKKLSVALLAVFSLVGPLTAQKSTQPVNDHLLMATLWFQRADEYRALCYQAFNLARLRLDQELTAKPSGNKKPAVVVDIDETVLDNSPFEARCIIHGTNYPVGWSEWVGEASADAIPGAAEFLNYAASRGFEVFYISNRKEKEKAATLQNLMSQRFPMVDTNHLMLRTTVTNKEVRRHKVLMTHDIVMLVGDNLNDFASLFEATSADRRRHLTDSLRQEFGRRFIVLPNPMYGDWESALGIGPQPNDSLRREARLKALRID